MNDEDFQDDKLVSKAVYIDSRLPAEFKEGEDVYISSLPTMFQSREGKRVSLRDKLTEEELYDPVFFLYFLNSMNCKDLSLSKWQLDLLEHIRLALIQAKKGEGRKNIFIAISGARGTGKTTLAAFLTLWVLVVTGNLKALVRLSANTEWQVKNVMWKQVIELYNDWNFDLFLNHNKTTTILSREKEANTAEIKVLSKSNASSARGEHAEFGLRIFDEASGISDDVFKQIVPGLVTGINITLLLSNPVARFGFFFEAFEGFNSYDFHCVNISAFESHINTDTDDFRAHEAALKQDDPSGDLYRVEILGQFPLNNLNCFFSRLPDIIALPHSPLDSEGRGGKGVIGIDIATGEGNDKTVIAERQDGIIHVLYAGRCSLDELADKVYDIRRRTPNIAIDAVCIGTAVKQSLAARNVKVRAVMGNRPSYDGKAFNKRAELYLKLRNFFEMGGQISVPPGEVDSTKRQLRAIKSEFTAEGKIRMEDKKKMSLSPDIIDAMSYTFAYNEFTHFRY